VSLLAGLVATAWQGHVAREASRQTQAEARKVERVNAFLTGMLDSVDPSAAPGPQGAVRAMLDEATSRIEAGALTGQPEVEASVRMTIGMTYLNLGRLAAAKQHLEKGLEIIQWVRGDHHADVAEGLNNLGLLARATGDTEAAEEYYSAALRLRGELLGARSAEYAETLNNLGVLLKTTGRLQLAETQLREALESASVGAVLAPNFSLGVNLFFRIVAHATRLLASVGLHDPFIQEAHHRGKLGLGGTISARQ